MYLDCPCQGRNKERLLVLEAPKSELFTGKVEYCGLW